MADNPPAAWYPDPSGVGEHRYWDGSGWTAGVAIGGQVMERPMPWPPQAWGPSVATGGPAAHAPGAYARGDGDGRIELPARAALYALAGFVAGLVGGVVLALVGAVLDLPNLLILALNMVGLWTGLLGACFLASRKYGTGHVAADFGLRIRGNDVGWGILIGIGARFAGGLVLIPFINSSNRLETNGDGVFDKVGPDVGSFLVLAAVVCIGAPLVEELFFRGLLLRSLEGGLPMPAALAISAVLFGLAHYTPLLGLANVALIAVIVVAGVIFGLAAHDHGVGRSAVSHATFNLVTVIAAAFLLY